MASFVILVSFAPTASGQSPTLVAEGVLRVGTIDHFAIEEGSGLAASRNYPGVFWTHNDGGYQFLFAVTNDGRYLGGFQVVGANLIDWEAVAPDDQGNLYLADIGSNGLARTHVAVHRVREPNPARRHGNVEVTRSWLLRFPGTRVDCEAFFVLGGYGYLITKPRALDDRVTMYRYPLSSGSGSTLLEEVARFPVTASVTDASVSADGQRLGVLTSQGAYLYFINGNPATASTAAREFTPFFNDFMEGGALVDQGFMVSAETRELWQFTGPFGCNVPPGFTTPLTDRTALGGSVVTLDPGPVGCPTPAFTWRFNGQVLAGRTNATLVLPNVTALDAGFYEVTASNPLGTVTTGANLAIRTKPDLRITEVMAGAAVSPGVPTSDWWELTSFASEPVDLTGWRFNDSAGGLIDPYMFPSGPVIAPGESIVFVEVLTPLEFRSWWGDTNLPAGLQIVTYSGSGLSFRLTGDTLFFWDNTSTDPADSVDQADFGIAELGITFNYDPITGQFGARSVLGVNGVIQAGSAPDIGSPGRITAADPVTPPPMPQLRLVQNPVSPGLRIEFDATAGYSYFLETSDTPAGAWMPVGDALVATNNATVGIEVDPAAPARFFRLRISRSIADG